MAVEAVVNSSTMGSSVIISFLLYQCDAPKKRGDGMEIVQLDYGEIMEILSLKFVMALAFL